MISPLRFIYENACRADTKGDSTAGAYVGYSAIRRGWIPSTWIRLHGLREADSPKFDFAGVNGPKALPSWRYQSKDLTCIILKLNVLSSWEESSSAAMRRPCLFRSLTQTLVVGCPVCSEEMLPLRLHSFVPWVYSLCFLTRAMGTHSSFQLLRYWKHNKCWIISAFTDIKQKKF